MVPIILVSHGDYAKASKESVELIAGDIEKCWAFSIEADTQLEDVEKEMEELILQFEDEPILVLCDILGGSPSNVTYKLMGKYDNVRAFTGYNLPVLLDLALAREEDISTLVDRINSVFPASLSEVVFKKVEDSSDESDVMDL